MRNHNSAYVEGVTHGPEMKIQNAPKPFELAVLGVFSMDTHQEYRASARASWMGANRQSAHLLARFVLRSEVVTAGTLTEAARFGDMIFVAAADKRPLIMLMIWWRVISIGFRTHADTWLLCYHANLSVSLLTHCRQFALTRWPRAQLIGKADDDVFVHLEGVAAHLLGSLSQAAGGLYWGSMDTAHWNAQEHSPTQPFAPSFGFRRSPLPCRRLIRNGTGAPVIGPFQCAARATEHTTAHHRSTQPTEP